MRSLFTSSPTLRVMRREFGRIAARKAWYILMIIMPLVVFSITSYIYRDRVVVDIPIGMCDMDNNRPLLRINSFIEDQQPHIID